VPFDFIQIAAVMEEESKGKSKLTRPVFLPDYSGIKETHL
jgi:hypothetical protein